MLHNYSDSPSPEVLVNGANTALTGGDITSIVLIGLAILVVGVALLFLVRK